MNLEEIWLAHLRDIVEREAQTSGGSLRAGYRSVASKMAKSEEYIYQLYKGKPKADGTKRLISLDFAKALARHYGEGRPPSWINLPPANSNAVQQSTPQDEAGDSSSVAPIATWPFKTVGYRRFMALPREAQRDIDEYLDSMVLRWEQKLAKTPVKSKRN